MPKIAIFTQKMTNIYFNFTTIYALDFKESLPIFYYLNLYPTPMLAKTPDQSVLTKVG